MSDLAARIENASVPSGSVAFWWLAQAGYVFKTANNTVIYLDPYLTDFVERIVGFKRLSAAPIDVRDVRADWIISSHEHADHLDMDALPEIMKNNPACNFAGSVGCIPEYDKLGIPAEKQLIMKAGKQYILADVTVITAQADHGELAPSALALLLDFGKVTVMFTGDTALAMDQLRPLYEKKPDVLFTCINGAYGNLNADEAAVLTNAVKARVTVPCHYGMFKEHHVTERSGPESFIQACKDKCANANITILSPGKGMLVTEDSITEI